MIKVQDPEAALLTATLCIAIALQLLMLLRGYIIGTEVDRARESCQKRDAPLSLVPLGTTQASLVRMYTIFVRLIASRKLNNSGNIVLSCVGDDDAVKMARDIQGGRITHALLQNMLLETASASIVTADDDDKAAEVLLYFAPYGSSTVVDSGSLALLTTGGVPLDCSTGAPPLIASIRNTDSVACVIAGWAWAV